MGAVKGTRQTAEGIRRTQEEKERQGETEVDGKQSAISKYWGREAFFSLGVGSQIAQLALSSLWSQDRLI